jgi:hypothetical protein
MIFFGISTDYSKHNKEFPVRHGITVCKKFKELLGTLDTSNIYLPIKPIQNGTHSLGRFIFHTT